MVVDYLLKVLYTTDLYTYICSLCSCSPVPTQTSSEGNLLRMVHQQLLQANAFVDVEKLRTMFSKADRSHRLTLSHGQVSIILTSLYGEIAGLL